MLYVQYITSLVGLPRASLVVPNCGIELFVPYVHYINERILVLLGPLIRRPKEKKNTRDGLSGYYFEKLFYVLKNK